MRDDVVRWAGETFGPRHADTRVSGRGFVFWVDTNSDGYHDGYEQPVYGGMSVLVLKRTGDFWYVGSNPGSLGVWDATTERQLRRALRKAGLRPRRPAGTITAVPRPEWAVPVFEDQFEPEPYDPTPPLTRERLVAWLRVARGWRHLDARIHDLGWAFSVSTQPDEYHDGNLNAMTYGNGPLIVIKRNGAAWTLSSSPAMVPAFQAATEDDFWRTLSDAAPYFDPNTPQEWIPR